MTRLAVKVDVDTKRGYICGVPRLLDLFAKHHIRASIFFSFGPDNSGRAVKRIFRAGFIDKMLRTNAVSTYGLKTMMYGTLLPAPLIVPSDPGILRRAAEEGHETGIHAWDHVYVQDNLGRISKDEYKALYEKAASLYKEICGTEPNILAAPGWQLSPAVLAAEEELGIEWASDTRGYAPFLPDLDGQSCSVPQIPTTLPTMDEIWGMPGINDVTLPKAWLDGMDKEWNVLTVHAEMEGISKTAVFENFLNMARALGVEFHTLGEYAASAPLPRCAVIRGTVAGRAGTLALQQDTDI